MNGKVTLTLTQEQRTQMASEMGVICDELMVSVIPKDGIINGVDLGENLFLSAANTYPIS